MAIWNHTSYRNYLLEKLGGEGTRTGLRTRLSEAIPVHTTFVSQVLKERADFSLEQAESVNAFFEHTEDESEYFLLMLLKDRAGTPKLRSRFERKIQAMRDERVNIKKRLNADGEISLQDREKFYSSFIYGAIHVLSSISELKTIEALAAATKLPRQQVSEIVEFLLRLGILKEEGGKLSPGQRHVHLGSESELVARHHTNWRLHTISNLQFLDRDDVHYSGCLSLSREDAFRIKESILENLKSNMEIVKASPEETAYVMNLDFYKFIQT